MRQPKPTPCLWFNNDAAAAAQFYCTIFDDAKIISPADLSQQSFMVVWEMNGQRVMGLNGGPKFRQSAAFSFFVEVEDQKELDQYWNALLANNGKESMCGWLEDQFGVSWQIIPKQLAELVGNSDPVIAQACTEAMLRMRKIVIADLQAAAASATN